MGLFFESLFRMVRDWWRAIVRRFTPEPEYEQEVSDAELDEWRAIEEATAHEQEVAEEERLAEEAQSQAKDRRTRPSRLALNHGWHEAGFERWWSSLSPKQKAYHHMEPVNFPEGVKLSGGNWAYWNTRALDRSRRFNYRDIGPTPTRNGMDEDGGQK